MKRFRWSRSKLLLSGAVTGVLLTWGACTAPGVVSNRVRPQPDRTVPPADAPPVPGPLYEEGLLDLAAHGGPIEEASEAAAALPLPDPAAVRFGTGALARGVSLMNERNATAAAAEFTAAAHAIPQLAGWAELLSARAFAVVGDSAEVRRRVEPLLGTHTGEWAWRPLFEVLRSRGDTTAALAVADRAAADAETAPERAFARAQAGEILAKRRHARAIVEFRLAMRESPTTAGGLAAARAAHDLPSLTAEDRLLIGRTLLAHGGSERGIPMLDAYASASSTSPAERARVRLDIGRLHFNARRYEHAIEHLRQAVDSEPEAAFLLGRALYRQGRQAQGEQTFIDAARRYPTSPFSADALFLLGDLAQDDGRTAAAANYYRQAVQTGVHNVSAADAAVRLAGISLLAGEPGRARQDLERYFEARPRDRAAAPVLYWVGRALLDSNETGLAREAFEEVLRLDPFSYYGLLAADRLGTSLADVPLPAGPSGELPREVEARLLVIETLREAGLPLDADLELTRLHDEVGPGNSALYEVAEAMARGGEPVAAALLAREIQREREAWDDRLLRIVFMFPYRDLVVREAQRNGLDPFAVAGLIRQESFFNPLAVSPAGAIGLMQVMPETGAGLARRAGISGFRASRLREPEVNLRLGTIYLADQMRRWDGRFSDVLGSYNAGPNRVVRWRGFPEHRDDEIYVERIPIAETRDYVKRVRLYAEIYRRLYSHEL